MKLFITGTIATLVFAIMCLSAYAEEATGTQPQPANDAAKTVWELNPKAFDRFECDDTGKQCEVLPRYRLSFTFGLPAGYLKMPGQKYTGVLVNPHAGIQVLDRESGMGVVISGVAGVAKESPIFGANLGISWQSDVLYVLGASPYSPAKLRMSLLLSYEYMHFEGIGRPDGADAHFANLNVTVWFADWIGAGIYGSPGFGTVNTVLKGNDVTETGTVVTSTTKAEKGFAYKYGTFVFVRLP